MAQEIELKLELPADAARSLRGGEFGAAEVHDLASVYYDTADRRLLKARMTLRLRSADGRWVQTVKGDGDCVIRFEDEAPAPSGALDVRRLGQGPIAALIHNAPLEPVFETRVRRRTRLLETQGGAVIELALDEGETAAGAVRAPIRELELELKSGDLSALFPEARRFVETCGAVLSLVSKADRGYALAAGRRGQAVKFARPAFSQEATSAEAFRALALAAVRQLQANTPPPSNAAGVEAIHQARVALRRLRAVVKAFKAVARDTRAAEIDAELKRLTGLFAEARALDVFVDETFRAYMDIAPGAAALGDVLATARAEAHARVRTEVGAPEHQTAVLDVVEWVLVGDWAEGAAAHRPIAKVAPKLLDHRRKAMLRRARRLDWNDPHARHALRIQAKSMRYLAEAFSPLCGDADDYLQALGDFQDLAGALNDIETAPLTLDPILAREAPPDAIFACGLIIGQRRAERPRLIKKARRAFEALKDCEPFWRS